MSTIAHAQSECWDSASQVGGPAHVTRARPSAVFCGWVYFESCVRRNGTWKVKYTWTFMLLVLIVNVLKTDSKLSPQLSTLSFSRTRSLKSPNSYEIAYDKYRESLSCPHPPVHDNIVYRDLTGWRYDYMKNDHIAPTLMHSIWKCAWCPFHFTHWL